MSERLKKQIEFIVEIDKLKYIMRQTELINTSRRENDAEHSWHLAVMAMLLSEYANEEVDVLKVMKMVLIHDLVEIDAGDTFCYDVKGNEDKAEREQKAADRIFNILPKDQANEIRSLWDEFEEMKTAEAKFAAALDRMQPLIHNYMTEGGSWKRHNIRKEQVMKRAKPISAGSNELWNFIEEIIEDSINKGYLKK